MERWRRNGSGWRTRQRTRYTTCSLVCYEPMRDEKCKRMTTEFNYMVNPRLHWSCVMASCKESCMEEIRHGHADIMTAEGEEIYTAGKMHDLIPIMSVMEDHRDIPDYDTKFQKYEEKDGNLKHYSIVLVKKTNRDVNNFQDMSQRKSCHSGVDTQATFKSPICSLIHEGVIPRAGNVYESAGEFFQESCVPGVQHEKYNPNMTNPESLCKLCKGPDDDDFCETVSDKEPYYGFTGTLKCLRDGAGDVAFVHTPRRHGELRGSLSRV
ncbi:antigen p97 (melanoma associated) [Desmophyllum pertusum]|uniref:Antigen p97 (Melanoma associated) n=1 Tax=Desmophyllum pertusum TaxID=174260 RepID=A0A9W9YEM9_9CNID|nr:antigen p97 (melanoma associated) [Desmophyllum pertusum]